MKSGKLNNLSHAIIFSYLATHFGINDDNEKMRLKDRFFFFTKKGKLFYYLALGTEKGQPHAEKGQAELDSQQCLLTSGPCHGGLTGLRPLCSFSSSGSHPVVPKKNWGFLLLSISIAHIPSPLTEQHKPGKNQ